MSLLEGPRYLGFPPIRRRTSINERPKPSSILPHRRLVPSKLKRRPASTEDSPMAPTSKMALGIKRASRSHSYHRRGLWAIKAKNGGAFPKAEKPTAVAEPKFYPADDVKPRTASTRKPKPTKLRSFSSRQRRTIDFCLSRSCAEILSDVDLVAAGRPSHPVRC